MILSGSNKLRVVAPVGRDGSIMGEILGAIFCGHDDELGAGDVHGQVLPVAGGGESKGSRDANCPPLREIAHASQLPTAMEQATIDRLGIFDEEKFAEIVETGDLAPRCAWNIDDATDEECGVRATHVTRCRVCKRLSRFLCARHAARVPVERMQVQHTECGSVAPLCELMGVGPL